MTVSFWKSQCRQLQDSGKSRPVETDWCFGARSVHLDPQQTAGAVRPVQRPGREKGRPHIPQVQCSAVKHWHDRAQLEVRSSFSSEQHVLALRSTDSVSSWTVSQVQNSEHQRWPAESALGGRCPLSKWREMYASGPFWDDSMIRQECPLGEADRSIGEPKAHLPSRAGTATRHVHICGARGHAYAYYICVIARSALCT